MKKLINIMLIGFLVFSNLSLSPAFAEKKDNEFENKVITLYVPDSDEDLMLYEDKELTEEVTHIHNNSPALLLENSEETSSSLVEIEVEEEKLTGYVQTEAIVEQEEEELLEYKLYTEKAEDAIQMYSDERLEDELYELADGTSVLVNENDLEVAIEEDKKSVFITFNPETEVIPEELVDKIKEVKDIQGFVEIKHLVSLEDEESFLKIRKLESEKEEATQEEQGKDEAVEKEDQEEPIKDEQENSEEEDSNENEQKNLEEAIEDKQEESSDDSKKEAASSDVTEEEQSFDSTKKEIKEKSTFSIMKSNAIESSTSRLGHIRGGERLIYETLGGESFKATLDHKNKVYYIKREATIDSETYYLLSDSPSATRGVVGWMKAKDLSTHTHIGVTKKPEQLLINGTGKATSKAWGGSKDTVHNSMKAFQGDTFAVNLTEKVGNNTWYRGKISNQGVNVWLHSSQTAKLEIKEMSTSRLGHIRGGSRLIYERPGGDSFKATSDHKNKVYYIKREATVDSETYYLLSDSPSATRGVVGWMKAEDLSTYTHKGVTKKPKQLLIKGTGKATSKAWGGSKDTVHNSMKAFQGDTFAVNLTEKVGNNTWYRGQINGTGTNVWLHSSQTAKLEIKETSTSRLGHIRGGERLIYETLGGESFKATLDHKNKVYYIKREATVGSETYYLLSNAPSATRGVVGWMKAEDLSTYTHKSVTKKPIQFTIKGTGKATSKAWGGSKDTVHNSMEAFQGEFFDVNLTEKVGNNTWYRGKINNQGANVWLHSSQVLAEKVTETDYGLTLNKALEIQFDRKPFIMNGSHGFIAKSLVDQNNQVKVNSNVRTMPQTAANRDNKIIKTLPAGTKINSIGEIGDWYAIEVGGSRKVTALANQIKNRLDPKNSIKHSVNRFQFLDLRKRTGLTVAEMNRELATRGVLQGEGDAFRTASITHGINEMYLIVHARLETGNGTSALSNGTHEVGLDRSGKPQFVTASNRLTLTNIKKTYNMFGIGAIDTDPARGGAITAYNEGWFTPSAAIIGGAAWIKDSYIYNVHNQNTLYKMRWNPNMVNGYAWKQYATDIDWALKQARLMHGVYSHTDQDKSLTFDIPTYR